MTLLSRGVPCIYPYYDGKYGLDGEPRASSESRNNLYFFNRYKGSNITHYNNTTAFVNVKLPWNIRYPSCRSILLEGCPAEAASDLG